MTYERQQKGPTYHWITELYRKLKLPVYDGVKEALERFGQVRQKQLEKKQQKEAKRKRIHQKIHRKAEQGVHKLWSSQHGGDSYGPGSKGESKKATKLCIACGSNTHSRKKTQKTARSTAKESSLFQLMIHLQMTSQQPQMTSQMAQASRKTLSSCAHAIL